jgi:hypothetical protein
VDFFLELHIGYISIRKIWSKQIYLQKNLILVNLFNRVNHNLTFKPVYYRWGQNVTPWKIFSSGRRPWNGAFLFGEKIREIVWFMTESGLRDGTALKQNNITITPSPPFITILPAKGNWKGCSVSFCQEHRNAQPARQWTTPQQFRGYLQRHCNAASGGELNPCPPPAD